MKRLALWLLLFGVVLGARAQSPDTEFLEIYGLIQEGESMAAAGRPAQAMDRFQAADKALRGFARAYPSWNPKIVKFRLGFLAERLGSLAGKVTGPVPVPVPVPADALVTGKARGPGAPPETRSAEASPTNSLSQDLAALRARAEESEARAQNALKKADDATAVANEARDRTSLMALELRQARDRVEVLEAAHQTLEQTREGLERERVTLESRLKEALGPRPAAVDPAELAKAEERILMLVKENEILQAGLDHQMAENRRVLETSKRSVELERQLASVGRELSEARKQNEELRGERQKLQARLDTTARKGEEEVASLRSEIEGMRKELASARAGGKSTTVADSGRELPALRAELAQQRAVAEKLRRDNEELRREVAVTTDIQVTPASLKVAEVPVTESTPGDLSRIRRLERERDQVRGELEQARAELKRRERVPKTVATSGAPPRPANLTQELGRLEAKLDALQARPEPYTPEELALFRAPAGRSELPGSAPATVPRQMAQAAPTPTPASRPSSDSASSSPESAPGGANTTAAASRRRTTKDLPPGASALASQAQRAFANRRLDEAELAYREILRLDENNVFTLGNLAAILVEESKIDDGEVFLKRALALDPQDPFSLSLLGIIRFRQQRYDDAFEALSLSAKLDAENSETQNYLGITLSQRGQRSAAEAALRKALKLNPGSPAAHYNLAVVYATQKPAFLELARYHYEKARRAGQPANPAFEGVLRGEPSPGAAP